MNGIKLRGVGHHVPQLIVTNNDLAQRVNTSDAWITERTGIRTRRYCGDESHAELCTKAAETALRRAGVSSEQIGVCIVATVTAETIIPSTACRLQQALKLPEDIPCFDLNAACTGFVEAIHAAECLLSVSQRKFGLVVGGEVLSRVMDWEDRGSCILFGDGAGAAVVESREEWPSIGAILGTRGDDQSLYLPGGSSGEKCVVRMNGAKVFKFALRTAAECVLQVLERHGVDAADVDQFVFHQANARILKLVVESCKLSPEKCAANIDRYGNTSAASIPILLSELYEQGKLFEGCRLLTVGFGGGLTWGGALIEYAGAFDSASRGNVHE